MQFAIADAMATLQPTISTGLANSTSLIRDGACLSIRMCYLQVGLLRPSQPSKVLTTFGTTRKRANIFRFSLGIAQELSSNNGQPSSMNQQCWWSVGSQKQRTDGLLALIPHRGIFTEPSILDPGS